MEEGDERREDGVLVFNSDGVGDWEDEKSSVDGWWFSCRTV